eukprot:scaffold2541_cov122-Isochrysis_galbana.AAC.1
MGALRAAYAATSRLARVALFPLPGGLFFPHPRAAHLGAHVAEARRFEREHGAQRRLAGLVLCAGLARVRLVPHHHRARGGRRSSVGLHKLSCLCGVCGSLLEVRLAQRLHPGAQLLAKTGGVSCTGVQLRLMRRPELLQRALLLPFARRELSLQRDARLCSAARAPSPGDCAPQREHRFTAEGGSHGAQSEGGAAHAAAHLQPRNGLIRADLCVLQPPFPQRELLLGVGTHVLPDLLVLLLHVGQRLPGHLCHRPAALGFADSPPGRRLHLTGRAGCFFVADRELYYYNSRCPRALWP